jgi:DNA-binding response OmpR family regulator
MGYRVATAASVAAALASARQTPPDALLVDLTLPDGDGLTIVRTLIEEARAPRLVVALTGHDDEATSARCIEAGCSAVWVKPIRSATLVAGLREGLAAE